MATPEMFGAGGDKAVLNIYLRLIAETEQATRQLQEAGQVANQFTSEQLQGLYAQAEAMARVEARAKALSQEARELQTNWWRAQRVLRATTFIFRNIAIAGAAIFTPVIASAKKYIDTMDEAGEILDPTVRRWQVAMRNLEQSQLRVGRTAAQTLLPYLEDVARVASKAAIFVEKNPEVLEAALKTGVAVAAVGTLGLLVTQGVKMVIDVRFVAASAQNLLAAQIMERAAEKQLAAATGQSVSKNVIKASPLGAALPVAGLVAAQATMGLILSEGFDKLREKAATLERGAKVVTTFLAAIEIGLQPIFTFLGPLRQFKTALENTKYWVTTVAGVGREMNSVGAEMGNTFSDLLLDVERLKKETEGAEIIGKLADDLAKMERDYQDERMDIIAEGNKEALRIHKRYADTLKDIEHDLQSSLTGLAADYAKNEQRAAEDHQLKRQEIVQSANLRIQRDIEDHQDKVRKLMLDHAERVDELVRARDALGLVKEERRHQRELDELNEAQNKQIARIRQDVAVRLREEDRRYALERQRRYQDYLERVAEAQARAEERRKAAAEQHATDLKQLQQAQQEKLAQLQKGYEQEKRDAIQAAYDKVVQLRGALNAEAQLRQTYYKYILDDASRFMRDYRQILSRGPTTALYPGSVKGGLIPNHQSGGYTRAGLARLHDREYVLTPQTTRAAEKVIGTGLTQQKLLGALGGRSITYNDHRRIDSRLSLHDRRVIANDVRAMLEAEL